MTYWARIADYMTRASDAAGSTLAAMVEAVKTAFAGDPELRRRVAFSVAIIALSAKMAKADGVVTDAETRAFHDIFSVPRDELKNVTRLYNLAKQDVAGFEAYAHQMASLCGSGEPDCVMLEDILDGLLHIAKADGVLHEREIAFLRRVAEIFGLSERRFERLLFRHARTDDADPYTILGVDRDAPFDVIKRRYRQLMSENHPDRLIARGVPPEFLAIANNRAAAFNTAYDRIMRMEVEA